MGVQMREKVPPPLAPMVFSRTFSDSAAHLSPVCPSMSVCLFGLSLSLSSVPTPLDSLSGCLHVYRSCRVSALSLSSHLCLAHLWDLVSDPVSPTTLPPPPPYSTCCKTPSLSGAEEEGL